MRFPSLRAARHALSFRVLAAAASIVLVSCSGGDKIVDPNAVAGAGSFTWNAADSSYLANVTVSAANVAIKGLRNIKTPDVPSYGKNAPGCPPTLSVGGGDTNGNGIPDDQTLQYQSASCSYTVNGSAATVAGNLRIQDLGEIFAYRASYTNLVLTLTKGDTVVTTTVNGSIELHWVSATAASYIDKSSVVIVVRSSAGSQSQTRTANLSALFTPVGGTIAASSSLPGGTMTLNGTLTIGATTSGNAVKAGIPTSITYNASVSTPVTLAIASSCSSEPVFGAGGALSAPVSGTASGTVSLQFTGCGGVPTKR
jgi:hypothetical protein